MEKKIIRLTESDIHKIVNSSVRRILKESIGGAKYAVIHTTDYPADGKSHIGVYNSIDEFMGNGFSEEDASAISAMQVGDVLSSYDGHDFDYDGIIVIRIE